MISRDTKDMLIYGLVALIAITLMFSPWVTRSYFEAAAFNRATGSNVSTWDAMWIELRVEGKGK